MIRVIRGFASRRQLQSAGDPAGRFTIETSPDSKIGPTDWTAPVQRVTFTREHLRDSARRRVSASAGRTAGPSVADAEASHGTLTNGRLRTESLATPATRVRLGGSNP